jgi:hypothetical protein
MVEEVQSLKKEIETLQAEIKLRKEEAEGWEQKYTLLAERSFQRRRKRQEDRDVGDSEREDEGSEEGLFDDILHPDWKEYAVNVYKAVRSNDKEMFHANIQQCPALHTVLDPHGRTVLHHAVFKVSLFRTLFPFVFSLFFMKSPCHASFFLIFYPLMISPSGCFSGVLYQDRVL